MAAVSAFAVSPVARTAATRPGAERHWPSHHSARAAQPPSGCRGATVLAVASLSALRCRPSRQRSRIVACAAKPADPPAPWVLMEVPEKPGEWYYWNEETGESSWDAPSQASTPSAPALGGSWQKATSPEGQVYYYNEDSGETSWTLPEDAQLQSAKSSGGRWRGTAGPDGKVYYYNEVTQETSWTLPEGAEFVVDGDEPVQEVSELPEEGDDEALPEQVVAEQQPADEEPELDEDEEAWIDEDDEEALLEQAYAEQQAMADEAAAEPKVPSEDPQLLPEEGDDEALPEQVVAEQQPAVEEPELDEDEEAWIDEDDEEALLEQAYAEQQAIAEQDAAEPKVPSEDPQLLTEDDEAVQEQVVSKQEPADEPDLDEEDEVVEEAPKKPVARKATRTPRAPKPSAATNGTRVAKDTGDFLESVLGLEAQEVLRQCPELKKVPVPDLQAKLEFLQEELHPHREPWAEAVRKDPQLLAANLADLKSGLVWLEEFLWNQDWAAGFGRASLAEAIQNKPFLLYQGEDALEETVAAGRAQRMLVLL
ncbi:PRP40A [Symbiodinium natans]|uniref:PRP40A protein n=1 Tax=Symbiodinium natans TaxID=878477 RepID=A0A812PPC0_9DINO|nr:PRP40A [Symbiodinium natans]